MSFIHRARAATSTKKKYSLSRKAPHKTKTKSCPNKSRALPMTLRKMKKKATTWMTRKARMKHLFIQVIRKILASNQLSRT